MLMGVDRPVGTLGRQRRTVSCTGEDRYRLGAGGPAGLNIHSGVSDVGCFPRFHSQLPEAVMQSLRMGFVSIDILSGSHGIKTGEEVLLSQRFQDLAGGTCEDSQFQALASETVHGLGEVGNDLAVGLQGIGKMTESLGLKVGKNGSPICLVGRQQRFPKRLMSGEVVANHVNGYRDPQRCKRFFGANAIGFQRIDQRSVDIEHHCSNFKRPVDLDLHLIAILKVQGLAQMQGRYDLQLIVGIIGDIRMDDGPGQEGINPDGIGTSCTVLRVGRFDDNPRLLTKRLPAGQLFRMSEDQVESARMGFDAQFLLKLALSPVELGEVNTLTPATSNLS